MDKDIIIEKITAYCEGKLSLEEQQSFEAKLKENPDWQTAYESYLATQQVLDQLSLQSLKTTLKESIEEKHRAKKVQLIPNWLKVAAAILLLVLAGTLAYQQLPPTPPQTLAEDAYINPLTIFPELSAERNGATTNEKWRKVLSLFQMETFEAVIKAIEAYPNLHPNGNLILAHAYFKNNQLEAAKRIIADTQLEVVGYKNAIDWLETLILIKEGEMEAAKSQLNLIVEESPSSIFQKQAEELLEKLEQ